MEGRYGLRVIRAEAERKFAGEYQIAAKRKVVSLFEKKARNRERSSSSVSLFYSRVKLITTVV